MATDSPILPGLGGGKGAARRRRTPKPALTVERILDTAFDVMARDGYEAISMRRLALELGTGPASLYAHIENKRELDSLIVDRVARDIVIPDPDPEHWQQQVSGLGRDLRAAMLRHPGVARAVIGYIPTGPQAMMTTERLLAILRAGGIVEQVAAWACDLLPLYVTAVAFEESVGWAKVDTGSAAYENEYVEQIRGYFAGLPIDVFPHVVASAVALTTGDGERRFEFGLQVLMAGIQAVSDSWVPED
jgi:AcrR family transcriptional regulator